MRGCCSASQAANAFADSLADTIEQEAQALHIRYLHDQLRRLNEALRVQPLSEFGENGGHLAEMAGGF